jgi:hypothetical protein
MNGQLERVCKEAVVAYLKVLFRHLPGELNKTMKNLPEDSRDLTEYLSDTGQKIHRLSQLAQCDYYYYYYYYYYCYNQWTDYYKYYHYRYPPQYGA